MQEGQKDVLQGCLNCSLGDDRFCSNSCQIAYEDAMEYSGMVEWPGVILN